MTQRPRSDGSKSWTYSKSSCFFASSCIRRANRQGGYIYIYIWNYAYIILKTSKKKKKNWKKKLYIRRKINGKVEMILWFHQRESENQLQEWIFEALLSFSFPFPGFLFPFQITDFGVDTRQRFDWITILSFYFFLFFFFLIIFWPFLR